MMKKRVIFALCALLMMSVLTMNISAASVPDMTRNGSVIIAMTYRGEPVVGGTLTLYQIAEVHLENDADYSFRLLQQYESSGVSLDDLSDSSLASTLAEYISENGISGVKTEIDGEGNVTFEELELGLYLLVQEDPADGFEPISPFLVSVPANDNGEYVYDVEASPKFALETKPEEPPEEPEKPPKLPQTGMTQWPVPVLAVSGLLLVTFGCCLCTSSKKKSREK